MLNSKTFAIRDVCVVSISVLKYHYSTAIIIRSKIYRFFALNDNSNKAAYFYMSRVIKKYFTQKCCIIFMLALITIALILCQY